jgi:hypothetical protein
VRGGREPFGSAELDPVRGPLGLRLDDEVDVDVGDADEVQRARRHTLGSFGVPQGDPVLAADPGAMGVQLATTVVVEHGARRTGVGTMGPRALENGLA